MRADYDPAPRRPLTRGERLGAALFALLTLGLFAAELLDGLSPRKLSVLFVVLFWGPLLVVHELGHALGARLVGFRVHEIVLGFGPELARFSVLGARVRLRLMPAEGYVLCSPSTLAGARGKSAFTYFAGPAAELLCALAALAWLGPATMFAQSDDAGVIALQSFALTAVLGAAMTLIPHAAAGQASDGLGILLSFRLNDDDFAYRMAYAESSEAQRLIDLGRADAALARIERALAADADNPFLGATHARCLAAAGRREEAMAVLARLRESPRVSDLAEGERLHAAACVVLASEDRALLNEAEGAARAALERVGGSHEIRITLAAVLVEQGRYPEADALLQRVYKSTRDPALEDRCCRQLAITSAALGRQEDAARFRAVLAARERSGRRA